MNPRRHTTDLARMLTRRIRDENPLRLETETLHQLDDADLARVAGGGKPTTGGTRPSQR